MNRMEFYSNLNKYKDIKEFKESPNHDTELKHYGILGQKWGNRRWQNADGTFNTEGKIRYFGSQKAQAEKMQDEKVGGFGLSKSFYDTSTKALTNNEISNRLKFMNNNPQRNDEEWDYERKVLEREADNRGIRYGSSIPIIPLAIGIASGITNYNDVQSLRAGYNDIMSKNADNYSEADRLAIMNNKKKIAKMEYALDAGDEEKYNKLLNKIKPEETRAAAEKLIKDMNKEALKSKPNEETQKALEDAIEDNKIGSLSKPKVNKKYLREDGTLNKEGERKVSSKLKVSDIASSVFKALRNMNIYEAVVGGPLLFAMTMSGFGVPMALGLSLGTIAATSGVAGIDNALYKKLEKRADAYYEMLK